MEQYHTVTLPHVGSNKKFCLLSLGPKWRSNLSNQKKAEFQVASPRHTFAVSPLKKHKVTQLQEIYTGLNKDRNVFLTYF